MTTAYDYSGGRISSAALIAAGVRTVMRYVSTPGNPKNITAAEYAELAAAGIAVGLVYETSAEWMLGGYSAGLAATRAARAQATAVGYPAAHRLWYAADFEASAVQIQAVLDCLNGCAAADGGRAAGLADIYGDYDVVEASAAAGYTAPWQTAAWSQGRRSNHAVLYQTTMQTTCGGIQVDINEVLGQLFAIAAPPALSTAAHAAFTEESSVQIEPTSLHPGEYALIVPPGVGQFVLAADGSTAAGAMLRVVLWNNDKATVINNLTVGGVSGHHVVAHPLAGATAVTVRRLDAETYPVAAGFRA